MCDDRLPLKGAPFPVCPQVSSSLVPSTRQQCHHPWAPALALFSEWPHHHPANSVMGSSFVLPCLGPSVFSFFQLLAFSLSDLARYFQGLGPPPKFQVTLNFWEEKPDPSHTSQSLIAVQVSQQSLPAWGWYVPEKVVLGKKPRGIASGPVVPTDPSPTSLHRWSRPLPDVC